MIRPDDLRLFVRAVTTGSFSIVAREEDLLPGQVSAAIQRLERELEVRLFARSTRSIRLTPQGEQYLPFARQALEALDMGKDSVSEYGELLRGTLQVAAPSDLGRNVLLPWLLNFQEKHPNLTLRLKFSDAVADVFREPVDLAFRYGELEDASFISVPIATDNRRVLTASPEYIRRKGRPTSIEDLAFHDCLMFSTSGKTHEKWQFPAHGNQSSQTVAVSGPVISDDADVVRRIAIAGAGILYKSWLDVCEDVRAGRLEILLPEQLGELFPLQLICPHRAQFSVLSRALLTYLQGCFDQRLRGTENQAKHEACAVLASA